mgnify:CR=1 FL=1
MKNDVLDMLILGGYSFKDCAAFFGISISEVRAIYLDDLEENA